MLFGGWRFQKQRRNDNNRKQTNLDSYAGSDPKKLSCITSMACFMVKELAMEPELLGF